MNEKKIDVHVRYMVVKQEGTNPNMELLIRTIRKYIQNNEIYFSYEPTFYKGVLLFSIIGFQDEQDNLLDVLGSDIKKLDCTLIVS